MTRITETSIANRLIHDIGNNRQLLDKYSQQVSSGLKVSSPGDTSTAGTVSQLSGLLERVESFNTRVASARSQLSYQNDILTEANDLLVRAQEIATQHANETNSTEERAAAAAEILQLRDEMVSLANTQYQGLYLFGGTVNSVAPFTRATDYTNGIGEGSYRYLYNVTGAAGADDVRTVRVADSLTVDVNTPGDTLFSRSIAALEQLGRALQGYRTGTNSSGVPDGTGAAYTFPDDYSVQTSDIRATLDKLKTSATTDIQPAITEIAGRQRRLDTAESLLSLSKLNTQEVLGSIRDADMVDSASKLSQAETILQASMTVTGQVLKLSILNYL
jgi:flagellar hook-associated protein 3 FlgL